MIPVKICGITNIFDAEYAIDNGASALGFIFYHGSPRYIKYSKAKKIINSLDNRIKIIGVFVNEDLDNINNIIQTMKFDFIQLHGDETPEYCNEIDLPIIKAIRVNNNINIDNLLKFKVNAFLFDKYKKGFLGGTGEIFNWELLNHLNINIPIILSGGLNTNNVEKAIKLVKPDIIDINSGIEKSPGIKDMYKLNTIMNTINKIDIDYNNKLLFT